MNTIVEMKALCELLRMIKQPEQAEPEMDGEEK